MRSTRLFTFIVCVVLGLSGCTTAGVVAVGVVGGTAAGYYVGKDERTLGEIADDVAITASVKTRFVGDKDVSALNINVDTYKGVVTLYGSMEQKQIEMHAMRLVSEVKGVKKVVSKITLVGADS